MTERKIYHVVPDMNGWRAEETGTGKVVVEGPRKEDVVDRIKELARNEPPSQVIVHTSNGRIEYENTYGEDPRRYQG